jgi:subtilase family serine protease
MRRTSRFYTVSLAAILLLTGGSAALFSQTLPQATLPQTTLPQTTGRGLIRDRVDEHKLVTLGGNTRPEVAAGNDLGMVADDLALDHMMLQLKRSPEQAQALEQFIAEQQDPKSANFHKWLTAAEFGQRFGSAESDIRSVTEWLGAQGFKVNTVYPSGMTIDFSGNAAQVRNAFHTAIHNLDVNGVHHIANVSDPQIPEALAPVVAGVVSMHDFRPHKMSRIVNRARPGANTTEATSDRAQYTYNSAGNTYQALVPADLATIYDFNPLFAKGTTGKGQTIVVIEDTNLYSSNDWNIFRSALGLAQYTAGSLVTKQVAPATGTNNCLSPGVNGDDEEAILDAEWASAAAPDAAIVVASCANTIMTSGLYIAGQNLVNSSAPPAIVSISYGECEAYNGASWNAAQNTLYQQAVAEGTSIFVAAGDENAASCDRGGTDAMHGISVSGFASTPYNVAVGGTDFADVYNNTTSQYWSSTNTSTYGSALSYIPEIPWNDSCAGSLLATSMGYSTVYGTGGFCNSSYALENGFLVVAGGSGGPSNCATGTPVVAGVAGGTCQGYAKPSWQAGVAGIANDGVRDIPDVSMFSSDGSAWGHYAVICFTDASNGGSQCKGAPLPPPDGNRWTGVGGTSLATPIMAGVQALINQSAGGAQGNPNPVYYSMAAKMPSAFHSITQGDITVNCNGPRNCFGYAGNVDYGRAGRVFATTYGGALSTSSSSFAPAYGAGAGWNFATGLGSVDVNVLVSNWGIK